MNKHPTPQELVDQALALAAGIDPISAQEDPETIRIARQRRIIHELTEMNLDMAREVHRESMAPAAPEPGSTEPPMRKAPSPEIVLAFTRLTRSVQQFLALENRVVAEDSKRRLGDIASFGALGNEARRYRLDKARYQVKRAVRATIAAEAEADVIGSSEVDRLADRLDHELADELMAEDLDSRPVGECIAILCKKLGVKPDWNDWRELDWAAEEIAEKPPGSPYAKPDWTTPVKRERPPRPVFTGYGYQPPGPDRRR